MTEAGEDGRDRTSVVLLAVTAALFLMWGVALFGQLAETMGGIRLLLDTVSGILIQSAFEAGIVLVCLGLMARVVWNAPYGAWWRSSLSSRFLGVATVCICGVLALAAELTVLDEPGLTPATVFAILLAPVGLLTGARLFLVARRGIRG